MKIKKIGHCCLVIEAAGKDGLVKRIMTDPGTWTSGQIDEKNIDLILITHEHVDHLHTESLKKVLENNPGCKVVTNNAVKIILQKENIWKEGGENFSVLENGEENVLGVDLFAKSCNHADIYDGIVPVQNTGYLVEDRLFYPGDAYLEIDRPVEILALPVAGPWAKIREVVEYAKRVGPQVAFPVHDGLIKEKCIGPFRFLPNKFLSEAGIEFKDLNDGESVEFQMGISKISEAKPFKI
jgi:L-ascorbate metabolism protein UlaG (beta-lactamase superfamily)